MTAWRSALIALAVGAALAACSNYDVLFNDVTAITPPAVDAGSVDNAPGNESPGSSNPNGPSADAGVTSTQPGSEPSDPPPMADAGTEPSTPPVVTNPVTVVANQRAWAEAIQAVVVAHAADIIDPSLVTATILVDNTQIAEQVVWRTSLVATDAGTTLDFFLEQGTLTTPFLNVAADALFPLGSAFQDVIVQRPQGDVTGQAFAVFSNNQLSIVVDLSPRDTRCDPASYPAGTTLYMSYNQVSQPAINAPLNVGSGPIGGFLTDGSSVVCSP